VPYRHTLLVRWSDCDMYQHVNNAVYVTYFEEARGWFWRDMMGAGFKGFDFIIAEVTCTYLAPAVLTETLHIDVEVTTVGTKSFQLSYAITGEGGRAIATGRSAQVMYDHEAKRSLAISPEIREKLEAAMGA
jgi:acyl-CoA thioester hydrolase